MVAYKFAFNLKWIYGTVCITDNRYICFIQQIHFPFIVLLKLITLCLSILYNIFTTLLFDPIVNIEKIWSAPNAGTLRFGLEINEDYKQSEGIYINNKIYDDKTA